MFAVNAEKNIHTTTRRYYDIAITSNDICRLSNTTKAGPDNEPTSSEGDVQGSDSPDTDSSFAYVITKVSSIRWRNRQYLPGFQEDLIG